MSEIVATIRRIDKCYGFMDRVAELYKNGVRTLRFNLGKTMSFDELTRDIIAVKERFQGMRIMIDVPYPGEKVRIRTDHSYDVHKGDSFYFGFEDEDRANFIKLSCKLDLDIKDTVLYNDGEGMFTVLEKKENGYVMESNGDFSMLDSKSLSKKSASKTAFPIYDIEAVPMDYLALSFVEDAEEIREVRHVFKDVKIIAKIETLAGVRNSSVIMDEADGIMIARGDLGLNAPIHSLLKFENELAEMAQRKGKICFAATDIMQTMRNRFFPSRADITDFSYLASLGVDGYVISLQLAVSDNVSNAIKYMKMIDQRLQ